MKLLYIVAVVAVLLLPARGWGQRSPALFIRPVVAKPESKLARYARLDQYARQLPDAQAATLEKLAASLAVQARNDDDKARLIFTWLACHVAYDVAYLTGDTTHCYTPEAVLQRRKAICQGYADLFTDLATRMKLEARTVSGHAYNWLTAGNPFTVANSHAWNAYRVAGVWHLADATWGAGRIELLSENFEQKFNPYWFDLAPAQSVFTHLPDEAFWQLLPTPVTPAAFRSWPYIEPVWFSLISSPSLLRAFGAAKYVPRRLPSVEVEDDKLISQVQVVQIPLHHELQTGQPVKFVFQAPPQIRLTIDLYDKLVVLQSTGAYQQATVTPTVAANTLHVYAWNKADSTSICSLEYDVVPATRLRKLRSGGYRAASADSVMYLRR